MCLSCPTIDPGLIHEHAAPSAPGEQNGEGKWCRRAAAGTISGQACLAVSFQSCLHRPEKGFRGKGAGVQPAATPEVLHTNMATHL